MCACLGNAGRLNASEEKKRVKSEQYSFGIDLERETGLCGDVRSPSMTNSLDGNRFCFVKEASCFVGSHLTFHEESLVKKDVHCKVRTIVLRAMTSEFNLSQICFPLSC